MFTSTKPGAPREDRKASIKNHNLPILQYMYMGSRDIPLTCLISKTPAFTETKDFCNPGAMKRRFRIDFNHIRQYCTLSRHAGVSLDKGLLAPSAIFRNTRFNNPSPEYLKNLIEFMTMIPVCTEIHSYISQDSAKIHITLQTFEQDEWPWILKSAENFNMFCTDLGIFGLDYNQFIDHLSNIEHAPLQQRLKCNDAGRFSLE